MEEIILIMLELLFVYPGALIRWLLFYRGKKTIKEVAMDDWFKNSYIGILVIAVLVGFVYSAL